MPVAKATISGHLTCDGCGEHFWFCAAEGLAVKDVITEIQAASVLLCSCEKDRWYSPDIRTLACCYTLRRKDDPEHHRLVVSVDHDRGLIRMSPTFSCEDAGDWESPDGWESLP
jgi:hypothetical protein